MSCEREGITPFVVNYIPTTKVKSDLKAADGELYLPGDVISEILSWLPVKSVQRFKCVCRLWCSIAQDRDFIHKHMVRATERIWAVEQGNGHLLKSGSQGLILETGSSKSSYRIRNPSTNRVLDLPDTNEKVTSGTVLFYISSTRTFKVCCFFSNSKLNGNLSFKILTVDADDDSDSWRTLDFPLACGLASVSSRLMLVKGVYFLLISSTEQQQREIVILEVENERVRRMSVPQRGLFSNWSGGVGLMDWAGKPSLYQRLGDDNEVLHVWVVEDYKKEKWAKEIIVIDLTPMKDLCRDYKPRWFYRNSKLEMQCNYNKYLVFDIVSKEVTHIDSPTTPGPKFQSRTSLIDFKGMKPLPA